MCRRSLIVSAAAAGDPSVLAPIAGGAAAWDALGGVSVLAAGTGDAGPLTDLWDPTEVLALPPPMTAFVSYAETSRTQGVAVVALLRHFGCFCW